MPATRLPLRERCNVALSVFTTISTCSAIESFDTPDYSRRHGRKRRKGLKHDTAEGVPHATGIVKVSRIPQGQPLRNDHCLKSLHELIPYLFLAFSEGNTKSLNTPTASEFTHIVCITRPNSGNKAGRTELQYDSKCDVHTLDFTVPLSTPKRGRRQARGKGKERDGTLLTKYQLLAARDFLSLALPYYSQAHPIDQDPTTSADIVRLLITAPSGEGGAVDIMAVAVCYLAFASGESVETVLKYINQEEVVGDVWKDVIGLGEGGVRFVEKVAMMGM
jgi:hypothetical protein